MPKVIANLQSRCANCSADPSGFSLTEIISLGLCSYGVVYYADILFLLINLSIVIRGNIEAPTILLLRNVHPIGNGEFLVDLILQQGRAV